MLEYIIHYIQPLIGLIIGAVIVGVSAYMYWKIDRKIATKETNLPPIERPMSNNVIRVALSFGLAIGGLMIILAIKFLVS